MSCSFNLFNFRKQNPGILFEIEPLKVDHTCLSVSLRLNMLNVHQKSFVVRFEGLLSGKLVKRRKGMPQGIFRYFLLSALHSVIP